MNEININDNILNNNNNNFNNSYDDILLEMNESEKENEEELQTYINKINSIMFKEGIKINSIEDLYDDKIYIQIMNSLLSSQKEKIIFINSQTQNEKIFNIKKILKHLSNDLDLPLNHIEPSSIIIEHEIETITFLLGLFYDLINYVKLKNEDVTTMPSENVSVAMLSKTVQLNESFCKNKILMECKMNDEDRKFNENHKNSNENNNKNSNENNNENSNENNNNNNNENNINNNINNENNIKGDEFSLRDNNNKITLNSNNNQLPTSHFNDKSFSNKTNSFSTNKNTEKKKPILSNNYNFNIKINESFNKKFSQQILNKSSLLQNLNQNNNNNNNYNNETFPIFLSEDEILSKILNLIQQIFSKNEFESISQNKNFPLKIYSIYIKIHEFYYNLNSTNHPITNQFFDSNKNKICSIIKQNLKKFSISIYNNLPMKIAVSFHKNKNILKKIYNIEYNEIKKKRENKIKIYNENKKISNENLNKIKNIFLTSLYYNKKNCNEEKNLFNNICVMKEQIQKKNNNEMEKIRKKTKEELIDLEMYEKFLRHKEKKIHSLRIDTTI